ncbi:hypothetical protein Ahy_B08g089833 isoform A [Arachis hypogaea]|uniref:Transposase MuDR plant domain-containing protein n=1 Tax=Arachis hypogaea TaxID=3818 RepID=A0A444XYY9_ARAHY|nr:hypothetical protein Ahy_B08g089833 isoform A [Arachis hypogaea]
MHALNLDAMHAPEFSEYVNTAPAVVAAGEFVVGIEFNSREAVIASVKEYTIRRGVDYRVYESEPTTFYAKCVQYGTSCHWLIRYCWAIRRYNGSHTCTRSTISQDHAKLDSDTIAEAIKPLVEADPSIKVKFVIAEVQLKFNYTISYRKAWLAKQKAVEKIFGGWESSYEALPTWFEAMVAKEPSAADETMREFDMRYQRLCERGEAYKQWLDRIPRQQYALAYDGGHCWGHMKTNLVECINGALKGACNLPVTAFVKATFYRLNALFTRKRSEVEARISAGQLFSEYATQKIMSNQRSAGIHRQRPYCRIRIQAHTRSNARGPSMSLQSYLDARHNDRYMCLCQAEPQLNL